MDKKYQQHMETLGGYLVPARMADRRETRALQAQWQAAEMLGRCMAGWSRSAHKTNGQALPCSN